MRPHRRSTCGPGWLGAALASTDPVAVSALARRLQLPPRLLAVVQGESLLNDATSLVLFQVVVGGVVAGHLLGPVGFAVRLVVLGGGGAAIGIAGAAAVTAAVRALHVPVDHTAGEVAVAVVTPYVVFLAAAAAHTSGVTAVVVGGLWLGGRRHRVPRRPSGWQTARIYDGLLRVLEGAAFAVIGLELPGLVRDLPGSERGFALTALAVTAAVLAVRVLLVAAASYLPGLLEPRHENTGRPGDSRGRIIAVTSWAGTRGVVPLAAALSIPRTAAGGALSRSAACCSSSRSAASRSASWCRG